MTTKKHDKLPSMQRNKESQDRALLCLCLLGNSACFLSSADFFQNQHFRTILSGITSELQTVGVQIRIDVLDDTSRQIFNKTLIYSELSQYRKLYLFLREMKGK